MSGFHYLRRPLRLILYSLLLALTTAAALIFGLQYHQDGIAMEQALDAYSFVGTLSGGSGVYTQLPEEVIALLESSELVDQTDIRGTFSAKIQDRTVIPDCFMTLDQIQQHYFVEATVARQAYITSDDFCTVEGYDIRVDRQWGGSTIGRTDISLTLYRGPNKADYQLKPGERVFYIGDFSLMYGSVYTISTTAYTPDGLEALGMRGRSVLRDNGFLILPEALSQEEREAFILDHLEQAGIMPLYEIYRDLQDVLTVRTTTDFSMLPYVASGRISMVDGRALTAEDLGKKVCLVSQNFSLRNRLSVGQTVSLAISDGCYTLNGFESGYPSESDTELPRYGPYEDYEIVGIYHQFDRDRNDPRMMGHNDIFIPAESETATPLGYNFSLRVLGPDHERFLAETAPKLMELGFEPLLEDSDWYQVESNFQGLLERRELMLVCALAVFAAAVLLPVFLLLHHFRYEFGLSRLLGAYRGEALRIYLSGFLVTALPGAAGAVAIAWFVYQRFLRGAAGAEGFAWEGYLCVWTLMELGTALALLLVLAGGNERRSLLRLVR